MLLSLVGTISVLKLEGAGVSATVVCTVPTRYSDVTSKNTVIHMRLTGWYYYWNNDTYLWICG